MNYKLFIFTIIIFIALAIFSITSADTVDGINHIETYKVRWWEAANAGIRPFHSPSNMPKMFSSVVFPAADGLMMVTNSPPSKSRLIRRNTNVLPALLS